MGPFVMRISEKILMGEYDDAKVLSENLKVLAEEKLGS